MKPILIYGAYGYSGRLALLHATSSNIPVVAAGRDAEKTRQVAQEAGCEYRVFSLEDASELQHALQESSVLLNCAGPFSRTAEPLARACIEAGTHYLDITGEYHVIESLAQMSEEAQEAGVMLMPATGFDVVPTDCMAAHLKEKLPDATHLELAFHASLGSISHGTAQTMVDSLGSKGVRRENGQLLPEPLAAKTMDVPFPDKSRRVMSIPWGDVASAYYTTGIPNIRTFTTVSPRIATILSKTAPLHGLAGLGPIRKFAQNWVSKRVTGPDEAKRAEGYSTIWGRVTNAAGEVRMACLVTLDGYTLTYLTSVDLAHRAQKGELPAGFQTPAGALGSDYVCWLENTRFVDISSESA